MPATHIYEYAFVRLVPRVERGECLNVGVIVFSKPKRFLDVRFHLDEARIHAFAPDLDLVEIRQYLRVWNLICQGDPEGGPIAQLDQANRFRWLTATRSTIIQSSKVHPGLCEEPEGVLLDLLGQYVG